MAKTKKLDGEMMENNVLDENIQDIDLSIIAKKKFRIDGDNNKIIELNTSDMNVLQRLAHAEARLADLTGSVDQFKAAIDSDEEDNIQEVADSLKKADDEMRELVDYIFDAPISAICASDGSMYDPFNGKPRYEHIIDRLMQLYNTELAKEGKKLSANARKHTTKYVG